MRKAKEILRLHFGLGLGKRQIARSCGISHSTVLEYIRRAEHAGLRWPLPEAFDDNALESLLLPPERVTSIVFPISLSESQGQGQNAAQLVEQIMMKKPHPEQGYRSSTSGTGFLRYKTIRVI